MIGTTDPVSGLVIDSTFFGFEDPDPLIPFISSGAGGGTFGPNDFGGGFLLDLGSLLAGETIKFDIFHGLSTGEGQREPRDRQAITGAYRGGNTRRETRFCQVLGAPAGRLW